MSDTAPFGHLRLAKDYLQAAKKVQPPPNSALDELKLKINFPAYFLVGHAVELALKAFLLGRGLSINELRGRKYGHNICALITECRRRKLGHEVRLNAQEIATLKLLNNCYSDKEFEYTVSGLRRLPSYSRTYLIAEKLCSKLESYSRRIAGLT